MRKFPRNKLATSVVVSALVFCLTARSALNAADPDAALSRGPDSLVGNLFKYANDLRQSLHERPPEARAQSDYLRILDAYNQVIRLNTEPFFSAESLARRAEIQREMADVMGDSALYLQAIESFRRIIAERPHSAFVGEALISIAQIYEENLQDLDGAVAAYRELIQYFPSSVMAREARAVVARFEEQLKNRPVDVLISGGAIAAGGPLLTNVRNFSGPDYGRVVIDLSEGTDYKGSLVGGNRLVVRLNVARVSPSLYGRRFIVGDSSLLKRITVREGASNDSSLQQSGGALIEIEAGPLSDHSIFRLSNPERIVIDLHAAGSIASSRFSRDAGASDSSEVASPPPVGNHAAKARRSGSWRGQQPLLSLPEIGDPILSLDSTNSAKATEASDAPIKRIVIDPGHGGHDTGTISAGGMREKDLVLDVARRLRDYIKRNYPEVEIILTRDSDRFVALEQRTAIANSRRADLFISIHANASESRAASGVETYFMSPDRAAPEDLETAKRENAKYADDSAAKREASRVEPIVASVSAGGRVAESRELARYIQAGLVRGIGAESPRTGTNRGVKHAPFVVLLGAAMPSVLAEVSFMSNPRDEALLQTAKFRSRIAASLFAGLNSYLKKVRAIEARKETKKSAETEGQANGESEN